MKRSPTYLALSLLAALVAPLSTQPRVDRSAPPGDLADAAARRRRERQTHRRKRWRGGAL